MTLMFCAFTGEAMILRVYGHATVVHPRDGAGNATAACSRPWPARGRSSTFRSTCADLLRLGRALHGFQSRAWTDELLPFYEAMDEEGVRDYWRRKNRLSIDGKPTHIL